VGQPVARMMPDILYWALLGAFFTHELDAVRRHE
jgi:hypothetical protein